jgi:hypothetical protein
MNGRDDKTVHLSFSVEFSDLFLPNLDLIKFRLLLSLGIGITFRGSDGLDLPLAWRRGNSLRNRTALHSIPVVFCGSTETPRVFNIAKSCFET